MKEDLGTISIPGLTSAEFKQVVLKFFRRIFFAFFIILSIAFILLEKLVVFSIMHYVHSRGYNYRRLLVVRKGRRASYFINKIKSHPECGIRVICAIDDEPGQKVEKVNDVEVLGTLKNLAQVLHKHVIDEVVFVPPRLRLNHMENALHVCETEGIKETIAVDLFDAKIARIHQTELDGIPLLTFVTTVAKEWQLFNVFVGHMSLIGPRPPLPKEVVQYESWQRRRLSMRPGITCLWQVNGRNKIDFEEWMKWDLEYLDNWSLWLDFKILVKTIPVVVFGIGAY